MIERFLAEGGMGKIYVARHVTLNTYHAIKTIRAEFLVDPQTAKSVEREAIILSTIRNEAVVRYDGLMLDESGRSYLIMEYLEGPSLGTLLEQQGPLSIEQILILRDRLLCGLATAHAQGIFHRDISPENIILPDGQLEKAKLIDFGIAKLSDVSVMTIVGDRFAGKLGYAAPEQFSNEPIAAYTDIYSLGLVLAAAATGKSLDMGTSWMSADCARKSIPDIHGVPAALREQLRAMLQPEPMQRPQNVEEILRRWPLAEFNTFDQRRAKINNSDRLHRARIFRSLLWIAASLVGLGIIGWVIYAFLTLTDISETATYSATPTASVQEPTLPSQSHSSRRREPVQPTPELPSPRPDATTLEEIVRLAPDKIHEHAAQYYSDGRLDDALALWEAAAVQEFGPSALKIGQLYDPVLWGRVASPFSKPNPYQAEKWYKRAHALGVTGAEKHLSELNAWRRTHPDDV